MRNRIILFAVAVFAQWAVPAYMLRGKFMLLSGGETYRFKLDPIDPRMLMFQRAVGVEFRSSDLSFSQEEDLEKDATVYATIQVDEAGFASLVRASEDRPSDGQPYMKCTVQRSKRGRTMIEQPFELFELDNDPSERARKMSEDFDPSEMDFSMLRNLAFGYGEGLDAHAVVRIAGGEAELVDVIVGGKSVNEWASSTPEQLQEEMRMEQEEVRDRPMEEEVDEPPSVMEEYAPVEEAPIELEPVRVSPNR